VKGAKRLSAVIWAVAAALLLLRAYPWSLLHGIPAAWLYGFAIVGPLGAHLVSLWVIRGYEADRGRH